MSKYYEVDLIKLKQIKNDIVKTYVKQLRESMNLSEDQFLETTELLKYNSDSVLANFQEKKSFLLYGDVQSGKTNNLINIVLNLIAKNQVEVIVYLTGLQNDLLSQNQERFFDTIENLNNSNITVLRNKQIDKERLENWVNKGQKIILNSLKTQYRLDQLKEIMNSMSKNVKFLVIDDEADEASLSTKSRSWASEVISKDNVKFLSITASPFSNLASNQNFYDYFQVLKSPKAYCGIEKFWDKIKTIENTKLAILYSLLRWIKNTSDLNLKNSQLLINIFSEQDDHKRIYELVVKLIENLKSKAAIKMNFEKYLTEKIDVEKIYEFCKKINANNIIFSNGTEFSGEVKNLGLEIVVGGIKLSRGITYKNLLVEVMLNMGKKIKAGTIIQRARWFGYRSKTLDHMEIVVNDNIFSAYKEVEHLIELTKKYSLLNGNYKQLIAASSYEYIEV